MAIVINHKKYFYADEVAKMFNVSVMTISRWTRQGVLKAEKVRNVYIYSEEAINEARKQLKTKLTLR